MCVSRADIKSLNTILRGHSDDGPALQDEFLMPFDRWAAMSVIRTP
jgi:hypothetical protein